ncbi:MAG: glucose-1-phosphate cytidylyltransferase [Synergistes sp.]|nr:glucose-1-phosphate cytidylyltransferase [Synergistes sp.]
MKCVILAGGLGTRLSEETVLKPKPMVEIGGHPILWHIMKIYSHYGINDFVICAGYKGYLIKEFFANYRLHMSDATFDMENGQMQIHNNYAEPWRVTCVDTGEVTMTGGRIKRIKEYVGGETFCMTYGDGVSDVNIAEEIKFHKENKSRATLLAVQPPGRYGHMKLEGNKIEKFEEKTQGDGGWINGGFFVLEPDVFELIEGDATVWEREPLEALAKNGELSAWFHRGFWRPMDTMRDKMALEKMWQAGSAPWKVW